MSFSIVLIDRLRVPVSLLDMRAKVYLETTIPSYLTAWPSRDIVTAAHQQITREWWQTRSRFELYISQVVVNEVQVGDAEAARLRVESIAGIPVLIATAEAKDLAQKFLKYGSLPQKAAIDAAHIAIAVISGMDYLLTWNCKHIANATMRKKLESICQQNGYNPPSVCTPEQLC